VVLIRRIHVGTDAAGFAASESAWRSRSDAPAWLAADPSALISGTPEQVATALADAVRASGCTSLNLRLDAHVNDPARVGEQIATVGRDVLPRLRKELGWEAP
jgi:hypothetical protein